ncbi:hypothetical protein [Acinetobacter modestus]|uniref:hypothetical protein n=1 Tax=Acinetobacter modestus TaxID=1776740 RepID=UPI00301B5419
MSTLPAVNFQKQSDFYQKAFAFQDFLLQFEQAEIPVYHHFSIATYARECHLPANTFVIGKVHRHAHINIISKGRVLLATPNGFQLLTAPCEFINEVGVKRVLYVLEDTTWTTVHKNLSNTQDLAKIEADVIVPEHEVNEFSAQLYASNQPLLGEYQ